MEYYGYSAPLYWTDEELEEMRREDEQDPQPKDNNVIYVDFTKGK